MLSVFFSFPHGATATEICVKTVSMISTKANTAVAIRLLRVMPRIQTWALVTLGDQNRSLNDTLLPLNANGSG